MADGEGVLNQSADAKRDLVALHNLSSDNPSILKDAFAKCGLWPVSHSKALEAARACTAQAATPAAPERAELSLDLSPDGDGAT